MQTHKVKTEESKAKKEEEKALLEKQKSKRLNEYDDITLFLLTIPPIIIEGIEEKFGKQLDLIKEGKITSREVLKKLVVR